MKCRQIKGRHRETPWEHNSKEKGSRYASVLTSRTRSRVHTPVESRRTGERLRSHRKIQWWRWTSTLLSHLHLLRILGPEFSDNGWNMVGVRRLCVVISHGLNIPVFEFKAGRVRLSESQWFIEHCFISEGWLFDADGAPRLRAVSRTLCTFPYTALAGGGSYFMHA